MGKQTQKKHPCICIPGGHPGCVWSLVLHVVKYPDWHYVKKRLPHRKHGGNKWAPGDENPRDKKILNAGKLQETNTDQVNSSQVQEVRLTTPIKKNSVKARIKSLVNEEFSKRKGQHHRTSTYPVRSRLTRTNSIHHLKASHEEFLSVITSNDGSRKIAFKGNKDSNKISVMDSLLEMPFDEPFGNGETGENCQVDENEEQASVKQNLINKEPTTDISLRRSKEFLDALDAINFNREFFQKFLRHPSSPFAHHYHSQQALNTRMGLTKSESFPLPGLLGKGLPGPSRLKRKQDVNRSCEKEEDICNKSIQSTEVGYRGDGIQKLNQAAADIANSSSSCSAHHFNNPGRSQVAIKHFKDLKQKIKHAIKENKNERHRIIMDAILHKLPRNQGFSKDLNDETLDQLKDPFLMSDSKHSRSSRHHRMRRTSSLNETFDRYCLLYESTFNREAKQPVSEKLKLRREEEASPSRSTTKSLGRIFSLPEIKSYYYQNEDFSDAYSSWMPVRISDEETGNLTSVGEQNSTDGLMASEYCSQLDTPVESQIQNLVDVSETGSGAGDQVGSTSIVDSVMEVDKLSDDLITLTTRKNASYGELDLEAKAAVPSPVTVFDFNSQAVRESTAEFSLSEESQEMLEFLIPGVHDTLTGHQHESNIDASLVTHRSVLEKVHFPSKHLYVDIPHVQVDAKEKAKFDYVKYILELTGFSGTESLGTWHSDDQPVDPSVYEEVGGCILLDPDCSGNEGGNCNHVLFFDLINEVLMEIYEKSYSYYPKPLSSQCCIPQMPAGNRVLKEVWRNISRYLSLRPELDRSLDYITSSDLSKNNGWMNLQFNSECVALEVEELIFEDLLEEVIFSGVCR